MLGAFPRAESEGGAQCLAQLLVMVTQLERPVVSARSTVLRDARAPLYIVVLARFGDETVAVGRGEMIGAKGDTIHRFSERSPA